LRLGRQLKVGYEGQHCFLNPHKRTATKGLNSSQNRKNPEPIRLAIERLKKFAKE
jgi:hypothetical protein